MDVGPRIAEEATKAIIGYKASVKSIVAPGLCSDQPEPRRSLPPLDR